MNTNYPNRNANYRLTLLCLTPDNSKAGFHLYPMLVAFLSRWYSNDTPQNDNRKCISFFGMMTYRGTMPYTDRVTGQQGGLNFYDHDRTITDGLNPASVATDLGAIEVSHGINWSWAKGFPSQAKAAQFLAWLESQGREHRGIYPQNVNPDTGNVEGWDVRYR